MFLRKLCGPKCEEKKVLRIGKNLEPQHSCISLDIATEIQIRNLELLGPSITLDTEPESRPGDGRPKLRRLDDVQAGIKTRGVKKQGLKVQDRKE
jgi:hypothetical protein